ncbi:MAG: dimethyl sulfoxide reductase anchor subunit [Alphaproteobacteria bacterium]|nr:dimethyl sulfoxide reductase anchor subunit [Alphaproteobacteria bacterium]
MKPAPSIIGFTTASGLGYGMLFVLALGALIGVIPTERWLRVSGLLLALGSISAGLLSSTLHLGHPERAWRALSQWRSSWLSREGVLALFTYVPALLLAAGWIIDESLSGIYAVSAITAALGAAATVYCTGMIYASLPPIKAWHQPLTAPIYLAFALMTGALAVHFLLVLFGAPHLFIGLLALLAIVGAFVMKILYWRKLENQRSHGPTTASATGLSSSGLVRMLDPPHTQTNYLLDEMGFRIGRKHAHVLKFLAYLFGLVAPLILTLMALALDTMPTTLLALVAFLSGMVGVVLERWLFFAEAEHTVMLFYAGQHVTSKPKTSAAPAKSAPSPHPKRRRAPLPRRRQAIETADVAASD